MEIQQVNTKTKGYLSALLDGKEAGRMTYSWAGTDKLIIDHSKENPEFKGKRAGSNW